jgi:hypothetical protein
MNMSMGNLADAEADGLDVGMDDIDTVMGAMV